jgi:hypothetical protein
MPDEFITDCDIVMQDFAQLRQRDADFVYVESLDHFRRVREEREKDILAYPHHRRIRLWLHEVLIVDWHLLHRLEPTEILEPAHEDEVKLR